MGYSAVFYCQKFSRIKVEPPGVIEKRDRQPHWIGDYSFYIINDKSISLDAVESMTFFHTLEHFLRELTLSNPALGLLCLAKTDIYDSFYRNDLAQSDIPKLGLIFPQVSESITPDDQPVSLPLVIPMVRTNSPFIFDTATETVIDNANASINSNEAHENYPLEPLDTELDKQLVSNSLHTMLDMKSNAPPHTTLVLAIELALDTTTNTNNLPRYP